MATAEDQDIVRQFLSLHEPETNDEMLSLLHNDCLFEVPFRNVSIRGRAAIIEHSNSPMNLRFWKKATFVDPVIQAATQPGLFFVEAGGDMILPNGAEYRNKYALVIEVRDGKIALLREYYNLDVINEALAQTGTT